MKILALISATAVAALSSCSPVGLADQPTLSKSSMSFEHTGAALAECGIVSQLEPGRATSASSSGGGCSSCH